MTAEIKAQTRLRESIRTVPDFPKPGINFYDITTVLQSPELFSEITEIFTDRYREKKVDAIVGIEARGFIFGAAIAHDLRIPFVPVRKPGKLPWETEKVSYDLEYGQDAVEIHRDAVGSGHQVVIMDDLIATGGTAKGTVELIERLGGEVVECGFVIELSFLPGAKLLDPTPVYSLVKFDS